MPVEDLDVTDKQARASDSHTARSYGWYEPRGSKIFKIGHSPAQHLLTDHVSMELQVVRRRNERKS